MTAKTVLTVGHSNHSLDAFVTLLRGNRVTAVADVRSAPYSRRHPQFNREPLKQALKTRGIDYAYLGRELGARSDDPSCYEDGRVQYTSVARTDLFRGGIERVVRGAGGHRLALMCAEREPLDCHRTFLVAPVLAERGITVSHILPDGGLEPHEAALERLLDQTHQDDLFCSKEERIKQAMDRRKHRIAYVRPEGK